MKKINLDKLTISRKTGNEPFCDNNRNLGFDLTGFWQWSAPDLVSNTTRRVPAEYIVVLAGKIRVWQDFLGSLDMQLALYLTLNFGGKMFNYQTPV